MSVNLIGHGLKAGRGLGESLVHIADILQNREYVRQTLSTQLAAIRTMVVLLVVLSAPLLYGSSMVAGSIMAGFNERLKSSMPQDILEQSWMRRGEQPVSLDFLNRHFMTSLLITSLLGSVIIGEVTTGRASEGLRYMFFMVAASQLLYLVFKEALMSQIGGAFV